MSREIKFRAFHPESGMVPFGFNDVSEGFSQASLTFPDDEHYFLDELAVMQYTGLKDANGVEIYEDDMLVNEHGNYIVCRFKWFEFWPSGDEDTSFNSETSTVLGNAYENPELFQYDK